MIASLDRLEKNELIEIVRVGNQKCNKIYVGKLERTITLGDYMKILNLGDEVEDKEVSINRCNYGQTTQKKD